MTNPEPEPGRGVRLVCFDLGGVLVRICRDWTEGCVAAGIEVRSVPDDPHRARHSLTNEHQRGVLDLEAFSERLAATFDGRYTPPEIAKIHRAWLRGEYEDVHRIVERINGAGVETACLSNTNATHWEAMADYPSLRALDSRHASHLMGHVKPDEACFAAFEVATGRKATEILFFEDTPENAVAAARRGWRAVVVDPHVETAPQIERALGEHGVL